MNLDEAVWPTILFLSTCKLVLLKLPCPGTWRPHLLYLLVTSVVSTKLHRPIGPLCMFPDCTRSTSEHVSEHYLRVVGWCCRSVALLAPCLFPFRFQCHSFHSLHSVIHSILHSFVHSFFHAFVAYPYGCTVNVNICSDTNLRFRMY